ncbi:MAG TPA: hypothetical protein VG676_14630 [Chitinophagaceae bacterium]|jgi:hypothetical protein|nr:hypothetical protein [Chitinophagaceae bacterium]
MKVLLPIIFALFFNKLYPQKNTYYINIPSTLKQGSIMYDLHADPKDSIFTITFAGISKRLEEAGFILLCYKEFKHTKRLELNNEILTPEMVMDSLIKNGRPFLRKNIFYVLFIKGENYYIHRVKRSEYLYKNYKDE